jgi:hypothetical protein
MWVPKISEPGSNCMQPLHPGHQLSPMCLLILIQNDPESKTTESCRALRHHMLNESFKYIMTANLLKYTIAVLTIRKCRVTRLENAQNKIDFNRISGEQKNCYIYSKTD